MLRSRGVIYVLNATMAVAAVATTGCSNSNQATSGKEGGVSNTGGSAGTSGSGGGTAAGGTGGTDAGGSTGSLNLQWKVTVLPTALIPVYPTGVDAGQHDASAGDASLGVDAALGDGSVGATLASAPPLPGVKVCVYQRSDIPCVTTQTDGSFTLSGLPPRTDIALTLEKSGYNSYLLPIQTASADMDGRSNPAIMTPSDSPAPDLGFTLDVQSKGMIQVIALAFGGTPASGGGTVDAGSFTTVPGTEVTLSPMSGKGPYFVDANNRFDLSATSFVGIAANYYNVAPGTYTLTFDNAGFDCEPVLFPFGQFGWPLTSPAHSLSAVVAAGYITGSLVALCSKSAGIIAIDGG